MTVLLVTHPHFLDHDTGPRHPERPERLQAVLAGVDATHLAADVVAVAPRLATRDELARVHPAAFVDALEGFCHAGGGDLDPDTVAGPASWEPALLAAGAGLEAVARLRAGEADAAFLAVRPPGHHASGPRAMGFCLFNNIAVTAAALAEGGERVLIVDWDAHHGNGTQDAFYADPRVVYISLHQYPWYPGTGAVGERGEGAGLGATVNVPFPAGTAGDAFRAALDEVVVPVAERFAPDWVLLSAGFDGHRADPLAGLNLTAGDYSDLTAGVMNLVPAGRRIAFLEGGYDLQALAMSAGACVAALAGSEWRPEPAAVGRGIGRDVVAEVARELDERPAPVASTG